MVLTADHGGKDIPERERETGVAGAARVDPALAAAMVGKAMATRLGLTGSLLYGDLFGDMYIDRALTGGGARQGAVGGGRGLSRRIRRWRRCSPTTRLAKTAPPTGTPDTWTLIQRARASFDADRSGDFVVLLKSRHHADRRHVARLCRDPRQPVGL